MAGSPFGMPLPLWVALLVGDMDGDRLGLLDTLSHLFDQGVSLYNARHVGGGAIMPCVVVDQPGSEVKVVDLEYLDLAGIGAIAESDSYPHFSP
jgi:hypothetical protein